MTEGYTFLSDDEACEEMGIVARKEKGSGTPETSRKRTREPAISLDQAEIESVPRVLRGVRGEGAGSSARRAM